MGLWPSVGHLPKIRPQNSKGAVEYRYQFPKNILFVSLLSLAVQGCIDTPPVVNSYSGGSGSIVTWAAAIYQISEQI
jgi:hypothetical protein